jgi:hypothetical protein
MRRLESLSVFNSVVAPHCVTVPNKAQLHNDSFLGVILTIVIFYIALRLTIKQKGLI